MNVLLNNLIQKERRRQLLYTISASVLIAILILSISYIIDFLGPSQIIDDDNTNNENPSGDNPAIESYVLGLSASLNQEFMEDGIVRFVIAGNITPSIHPRLIYSELTPDFDDSWNVDASVLNATTMDPLTSYQDQFTFTNQQMITTHNSFLKSLNQTEELNDTDIPDNSGSIPYLLFYEIYLENGTGYEFVWAGYQDVDIMEISHFTWSGPVTSTVGSNLEIDQFSHGPSYEKHYITPLTAFDSFIGQLQMLYASILDV